MGVIYKLTPEVSSFIIEQKQNDPKITCQNLAGTVFLKFGSRVSKSSVHALLKQTQTITPRKRKVIKEKFTIPSEKKAAISKALEPFKATTLIPKKEAVPEEKFLAGKGDIFLKAVLWDLSSKPVLGLNDDTDLNFKITDKVKAEWEYLTQLVYAIKIDFVEDGQDKSFYLDPRFQGLYAQNPQQEILAAPVERVACEVADHILNNVKPLIIRFQEEASLMSIGVDFFKVFDNKTSQGIKNISLVGPKQRAFTEFNEPIAHPREFILGISSKSNIFQWFMEDSRRESTWKLPLKDGVEMTLRIFKNNDKILITNINSMSYDSLIEQYNHRHPGSYGLVALNPVLEDKEGDPEQWIKHKLKERALMFFPQGFSLENLEEILSFSGKEIQHKGLREVYLQIPQQSPYFEKTRIATERINNLSICDSKARILRIFVKQ